MTLQEYAHAFISGYASATGFTNWDWYITVYEDFVQIKTRDSGDVEYTFDDTMSRFVIQDKLVQAVRRAEEEADLRLQDAIVMLGDIKHDSLTEEEKSKPRIGVTRYK